MLQKIRFYGKVMMERSDFVIRVLFICHGNICRSPMAEFIFKNMVSNYGESDDFYIASAGTSYEEIGNPVHRETARILDGLGITYKGKVAVRLEKSDYEKYDYLICMDTTNLRNTLRIVGEDRDKKVYKLLEFTHSGADVSDPYYTGGFHNTYRDITEGLKGLYQHIKNNR